MKVIICFTLLKCLLSNVFALNHPSPPVFVVTPSPRSHSDEGRSAPFYYHNWRRRMDPPSMTTTTAIPTTMKVKTPDLIFAEFESDGGDDMKKSIRNLLEKERVRQKTSATMTSHSTISQPIYVPDDDMIDVNHDDHDTSNKEEHPNSASDTIDNSAMFNKFPEQIYLPSTTTTTSTTPSSQLDKVENIWHIIDNEKRDPYSGKWEEVPIESNKENTNSHDSYLPQNDSNEENTKPQGDVIDDNFAFPGFASNPGNGAENESRAIRTEQNLRFPYVSLKPFQMKNMKQPNGVTNSKKSNNMFNLDNFRDIQNPVRGEVQDVNPVRQPIDRYNPAQPYLPHDYGSKSKQSSPPTKAVANLVPPPPPPPPKITGNDFPAPTSYESFPPFAGPDMAPNPSPPARNPPVSMYKPPNVPSFPPQNDDSDDGSMDLGYQYQAPQLSFRPTLPPAPASKPFSGYSYDKPPTSNEDTPPATNGGYSYQKPQMTMDSPPSMAMDDQEDSPPMADDKPDFHGYHYNKPPPEDDHPPPVYKPHGPFHHEGDYPELIFDKPHGGPAPMKGGDNMNDDGAGMMPPPPPAEMKPDMDSGPPMDDHGFPPGFPGDFKFHHDFDDHDLYHHHHHHPTTTTTTTTTESPRVNRYSYYYLGKKLYYLPLYFSVYFIVYVGALIIKAVLRHKIVYPNSWRPNDTTASFLSKRSLETWDLSHENLHEVTGRVTKAIGEAAEKYISEKNK